MVKARELTGMRMRGDLVEPRRDWLLKMLHHEAAVLDFKGFFKIFLESIEIGS
jgi:hypothetical protein